VVPGLLVPAERRERAQVVGRAGIHRAGVAHDADRTPSGGSVGGELPPQGLQVNRVVGSDGNRAQCVVAEAKQLDSLAYGRMSLGGRIDAQPRAGAVLEAALADIEPRAGVAGDRETHEVRHRPAGDEQAVRAPGKSEQLDEPSDHLVLHHGRRVVELGDLGIHPGRQHVGQHAHRCPRPDHPAPEARMDVAGGVGEHVALEFLVDVRRRRRLARRRAGQPRAHLGRDRPPDGAFPRGPQILEHLVHHAMAELAQLLPLLCALRVEANLRR